MALLELLNVGGDSQEESATVTETWYCEYSDVASRYALDYPAVGVPWGIINKPCGYEAGTYELKLPVLQIDKSIVIRKMWCFAIDIKNVLSMCDFAY